MGLSAVAARRPHERVDSVRETACNSPTPQRCRELNMQAIAEPAIATAVGCIALIAAVPLTTGLAAALVARVPPGDIPGGHAHVH